jgi:MarR family transcriptional regulator for hemolysin
MPRPPSLSPIGLQLATTGKRVSQAFDATLSAAGGSRSTWLVLVAVKSRSFANQQEIAEVVGIRGPTLTHHLNAMEADGLLTRRRHPTNRRVHVVELTGAGEEAFEAMRGAAVAFDHRLRRGMTEKDVKALERLLHQMVENVSGDDPATR